MPRTTGYAFFCVILWILLGLSACATGEGIMEADGDVSTDGDEGFPPADGDDEKEMDTDTENDSDHGGDIDSEPDGDFEIDGDADSDGDLEPDGGDDAEAEPDGDADPNPDGDADAESDEDGDIDPDPDGDADAEPDTEPDAEPEQPPAQSPSVQSFEYEPLSGGPGTGVTFNASAEDTDSDGLTAFIDFDGNGSYDEQKAASPVGNFGIFIVVFQHTYNAGGSYTPKIRFTDEGSRSAEQAGASAIVITGPQAPSITSFTYSPLEGPIGTQVNFEVVVSDTDSSTLTCQVDFDGNGSWDDSDQALLIATHSFRAQFHHTYPASGSFRPKARCTDPASLESLATGASLIVIAAEQAPEILSFTYSPYSGATSTVFTFTVEGRDTDSQSLQCGVDYDGDGGIDQWREGTPLAGQRFETTFTHTYPSSGSYRPKARCRDPESLMSDMLTGSITLQVN